MKKLLLIVTATVLSTSSAHATALTSSQILSQFNAVISNNFNTGADVEGRLVTSRLQSGATLYNKPNSLSGPSSFQAVNAINITGCGSCNVNNGGSVNYVTSNSGHFNLNGGGTIAQGNPSFSITDFTTPLNALATQLAGLNANSTVNSSDLNNFTFNATPNAQGVAIFSLAETLLASANNILFNPSTATTIFIDVTGPAGYSFTQNGNFNGSAFLNEHIIWNFEAASSLNLKYWHGTVLASEASVTNSSPIEGLLYAKNFTGNGELHSFPFLGILPATVPAAVPEPSGWVMMLVGFLAIGLGVRSRSRMLPELHA